MSQLIELPLSAGGTILVEVAAAAAPAGAEEPVTRGWGQPRQSGPPRRVDETFEAAISKVRPAADAVLASLTGLVHAPDEVTVEFAIELSAHTGAAFIAALGSTANFKVQLTWRRNDLQPPS